MHTKVVNSLKSINLKLFLALLIMGLCPTLYTTLRTYFLGQIPGEWSYSIAGQLSWVNLIYEVINEAIILPLYFFMGQAVTDKEEYSGRLRSGLILSAGIYAVCSAIVIVFIHPLLNFMAVLIFYVLYAFQNVFDATFYGRGRTDYMLFESVVTNSVYYGAFFVLYLCGIWTPTLTGIALMFGFGNAFDSIVSYLAYRHFIKKSEF
jgi:hypothetical protein